MPETLHVAIVDDHPLFREGVAHTLAAQPDIEIVGEGESASDAIRIAAERIPDVMLLDVSMPGGGLSAVREIAATFPVIKLVMLTVSEDEDDVTAALRAGARAYVLKGVAARELVRIMRAVGMPNGLSALGYADADCVTLADGAWPQQRLLQNAPINSDKPLLARLFEDGIRYW